MDGRCYCAVGGGHFFVPRTERDSLMQNCTFDHYEFLMPLFFFFILCDDYIPFFNMMILFLL